LSLQKRKAVTKRGRGKGRWTGRAVRNVENKKNLLTRFSRGGEGHTKMGDSRTYERRLIEKESVGEGWKI